MFVASALRSKEIIIKVNIVTFLLLFLVVFRSNSQTPFNIQKVSESTLKVVGSISKINEVMGATVYYEQIQPNQFDFFVELTKIASKDELMELVRHPNAVVRCYAFWALSCIDSTNLLKIVIEHINDTSYVRTQFGCSGNIERVGDFFIQVVTPRYLSLGCKKLDPTQRKYLDSVIVYTPNILTARIDAISSAVLTEKFYIRLQELVKMRSIREALVILARYQKRNDVPTIMEALTDNRFAQDRNFAYRAVSEFPYPDFYPILQNHLDEILKEEKYYYDEWKALYKAIASYKNEEALKSLQWSLKKAKHDEIRQYHVEFICAAITTFKSPIYDNLLWTIWTDENLVSEEAFEYLMTKDSQKLFNLSVYTLNHLDAFHNPNVEFLIPKMLDVVLAKDKGMGLQIIGKNLKETYVTQFLQFAARAEKIKDTSFVEPLFWRLNTELNPHICLKAASVLILYNNSEINRRILEAKKINSNLSSGWGGEEFAKLLVENNIK